MSTAAERNAGVARQLLSQFFFKSVRDGKAIYRYVENAGVFRDDAESYIAEGTQRILGDFTTNHSVAEVEGFVRRKTFLTDDEVFDDNPDILVVGNGVLNLGAMTLTPHSPVHLALRSVAVDYDPSADCPTVKRVLSEDLTAYDKDLFIKYLGYLLIPDNRFKRALALVGPKDTGKTTLLDLTQGMLGSANVANETLQNLCDRNFAEFELVGKMANLRDDMLPLSMQNAEKLKELTGGFGASKVEQKYVQRRTLFQNRSKLMFTCNAMPLPKRPDPIYFGRWVIIEMRRKFSFGSQRAVDKADTTLREQMMSESSGVLNLALEGRRRLLESNGFPELSDEVATMRYMAYAGDTLGRFISDRVKSDHSGAVTKGVAYGAYIAYCAKMNEPSKSDEEFRKMLTAVIPTVLDGWIGKDKAWRGISLRPEGEVAFQPRFSVQINPSSFTDDEDEGGEK